jgi:hypothetical protein
VIVLPGRVVRAFVALLRRCGRPPTTPSGVAIRQGSDGLSLSSWRPEIGLRWHEPGRREPAGVAVSADHLADIPDDGVDWTIVPAGFKACELRFGEAGRTRTVPATDPDIVPAFPTADVEMTDPGPAFPTALAEASKTAAHADTRFAFSRVLIRGTTGHVVGTDGAQLLVWGGFRLPWDNDVLILSARVYGARELVSEEAVTVGRSAAHVLVAAGPWALALRIDPTGRYPPFDDIIPRGRPAARCPLAPADGIALPPRSGRWTGDDPDSVTLDVSDGKLIVRSIRDGAVEEIHATRSDATGEALAGCARRHLARAIQLGLTTVELRAPGTPLVARDRTRTYVWVAHNPDELRPRVTPSTDVTDPNEQEVPMPPNTNGHAASPDPPRRPGRVPGRPPRTPPGDLRRPEYRRPGQGGPVGRDGGRGRRPPRRSRRPRIRIPAPAAVS